MSSPATRNYMVSDRETEIAANFNLRQHEASMQNLSTSEARRGALTALMLLPLLGGIGRGGQHENGGDRRLGPFGDA